MPSPIAHVAVGYAILRGLDLDGAARESKVRGKALAGMLLAAAALSVLPDLPSLAAPLVGDFKLVHNNWEHSLALVPGAAVVAALGARILGGNVKRWSLAVALCYAAHVMMDYATVGRGVMLLWPFSEQRLSPPFPLFYGLRWSEGWLSLHHLVTLVTEMTFAAIVLLVLRGRGAGGSRWRRSEVER